MINQNDYEEVLKKNEELLKKNEELVKENDKLKSENKKSKEAPYNNLSSSSFIKSNSSSYHIVEEYSSIIISPENISEGKVL